MLNGMGLRTKYMVNAGLYLEQKSAAPTLGSNPTQQKRIVMQFLHGASKSQMADAFYASFTYTPPVARDAMKADVDRFAWSVGVKTGDQMVSMIFRARARSSFSMAAKADHPRPLRSNAVLVWLGPKPPNLEVKKGLLGQ